MKSRLPSSIVQRTLMRSLSLVQHAEEDSNIQASIRVSHLFGPPMNGKAQATSTLPVRPSAAGRHFLGVVAVLRPRQQNPAGCFKGAREIATNSGRVQSVSDFPAR